MSRVRLGTLVLFAALVGHSGSVSAQGPVKDSKAEPAKDAKSKEPKNDQPREPSAVPLDKVKLPPGAILVIVESLKDAAQFGKLFLLTPEEFQDRMDKLRLLEQQLKPERGSIHACKFTGRLDGDYVALRAEFTFSTPHTSDSRRPAKRRGLA